MKLEVGKSYRTNGGKKVTMARYDCNDDTFISDDGVWYASNGCLFGGKPHTFLSICAEWEDEKPQPKYHEGDLVTIRLGMEHCRLLNNRYLMPFREDEIISHTHTPAPFDWSTAKQGMAFCDVILGVVYFMCADPKEENYVVVAEYGGGGFYDAAFRLKEGLTRAPENDIEV